MTVLVGDQSVFAIEADIFCAFEERSLIGLGYFLIHLGGVAYGEKRPDATMLANSLDEIKRRLAKRGRHTAGFLSGASATEIAHAYYDGIYGDTPSSREYFGLDLDGFLKIVYEGETVWAPDGDSAFDDGSNILQFDDGDVVRLVGFKVEAEGEITLIRDVVIDEGRFYHLLRKWVELFEILWMALPKNPSAKSH